MKQKPLRAVHRRVPTRWNRFSRISIINDEAGNGALLVGSVRRGFSAGHAVVSEHREPRLFNILKPSAEVEQHGLPLCGAMLGSRRVHRPVRDRHIDGRLTELGLLLPEHEIPRHLHYRCALSQSLPSLLPQGGAGVPGGDLVDTGFAYGDADRPPPFAVGRGRAPFLRSGPCVWQLDAGTRAIFGMRPSSSLQTVLSRLRGGSCVDGFIPRRIEGVLRSARILVDREYLRSRQKLWESVASGGPSLLCRAGYLVIRELIPAYHVA